MRRALAIAVLFCLGATSQAGPVQDFGKPLTVLVDVVKQQQKDLMDMQGMVIEMAGEVDDLRTQVERLQERIRQMPETDKSALHTTAVED